MPISKIVPRRVPSYQSRRGASPAGDAHLNSDRDTRGGFAFLPNPARPDLAEILFLRRAFRLLRFAQETAGNYAQHEQPKEAECRNQHPLPSPAGHLRSNGICAGYHPAIEIWRATGNRQTRQSRIVMARRARAARPYYLHCLQLRRAASGADYFDSVWPISTRGCNLTGDLHPAPWGGGA